MYTKFKKQKNEKNVKNKMRTKKVYINKDFLTG